MKKIKFSFLEVSVLVITSIIISLLFSKIIYGKKNSLNDDELEEFYQSYENILNNYYEDIDKQKLIDGAIEGMISTLDDDYSVYMDEVESDIFNKELNGYYEGIGISVSKSNNKIIITNVIDDSPASRANIKINDEILVINNQSTDALTIENINEIVSSNKKINLKLKRDDEEYEVSLKKEKIILKSVISDEINYNDKKIGYIYMSVFASNSDKQFSDALTNLENDNIDALIIDLRNNTGGHLSSLKNILSLFLSSDKILYQFDVKGEITKTYSKGKEDKKYDIVILTNSVTASASEVMAISLKENLNATLIGTKTYGKGTSQDLKELDDGSTYKITTKSWLSPSGKSINNVGIVPDIEINDTKYYFNNSNYNEDATLNKALEYICER